MKPQPGHRKLTANYATQLFLIGGLLVVLVASGYFKLDTATCVQAYLIFAGALVGGHAFFMVGNAAEHKYTATPKPPTAPQ